MNSRYIIAIIVLVCVGIGVWFYMQNRTTSSSIGIAGPEDAAIVETVSTGVSSGVGTANPFNKTINPYEGYKNPFAN